jgi:hypothetical protein
VPVPIPEYYLQINKNLMNQTFHFRQEENLQEKCAAEKLDEIGAQVRYPQVNLGTTCKTGVLTSSSSSPQMQQNCSICNLIKQP